MCRRGNASKEGTEYLVNNKIGSNIVNVEGGIDSFIDKIDTSLPKY
jgi:rhodanese-related sulfurtransferase